MKKLILLLLLSPVCLCQQLIFQGTDGKLYKRVTTGVGTFADSEYVVTATATVDSAVWTKLWKFNQLNQIVSLITQDTTGWTNSQTLTSAMVFDTLAFSSSATRTAKKITGILPTSYIIAVPRKQADALPVAGDLLSVRCKTDSVVIFRAAGTTSGLQVTIIGKK